MLHRLLILPLLLSATLHAAAPQAIFEMTPVPTAKDWKMILNKVGGSVEQLAEEDRLKLTVPKPSENSWDFCLHSKPLDQPIKKGQKVWLSFPLKLIGHAERAPSMVAYVERIAKQGALFRMGGQAYAEEIHVQETWVAEEDFAAGELRLSLHFAQEAQTVAIGPMKAAIYSPDAEGLPSTKLSYPGRELHAAWRDDAMARIRQHRMSDVKLTLKTLAGTPVKDAEIRWDQSSHRFGFGSFVEGPLVKDTPDGQRYRDFVLKNFNYATIPAYLAEWGWLKEEGRQQSLKMADWLMDHGIPARGHLLVYPGWVATPQKWKELPAEERRKRLEAHFTPVLKGLGDRGVREYDVVNELRTNIGFCDDLGKPTGQTGLQVVTDWFKLARKMSPESLLYINEYWILGGGGYTQKEQDTYYTQISELLAMEAPLDGIGLQGHFGSGLTPPKRLIELLDRFAKQGKRLRVTEFDIDIGDEQAQADYTRDFYLALYSHPAVDGIVQWGFWETTQWKPRAAMVRKDWSLKPNYHAFRQLTQETLASHHKAKTNSAGQWTERVHQGKHRVTLKVKGYERSMEVIVPPEGLSMELSLP
jgi:endo-1,4-beta-xylanase